MSMAGLGPSPAFLMVRSRGEDTPLEDLGIASQKADAPLGAYLTMAGALSAHLAGSEA